MNSIRKWLPPMSSLVAFEAAVRHGGFSRAGDQIGLTQSAVSRQIAGLEDWLQTPLFDRIGRRVRLNDAGRAYADDLLPALDRIRRASARASARPSQSALRVATLPSFGMRWLAPRLPQLTARHPDLVIDFAARSQPFDFGHEDFDSAVHFGVPQDWPGVAMDFLFREEAVPVCAPAWLAAHPLRAPQDLLHVPLLSQSSRRDAWPRWLRAAGVDASALPPGPAHEHFLMLAQAVAAGAGVALIPSFLIRPELEAGTLVIPFARPLSTDQAYYLVYPPDTLAGPLAQFRDWMVEQARGA
ncbi:LysR substrate-binding domain-containing protein [Sphingobium sp. HBC34]|uniref:LysR substrate-binding domain-containing protein n=1 Tax=Sphingobium cyanobacteriorum TaxID=3063954 RepID=A0ABT8ZGM2_9SPHN|nr:LysR substrate-binding domain-containing protein [Sphingobium sp. HBC34]MDO7833551.1 LysR substrate-binding domain-containing protein [Sphingobium sp. HBC34]